MLPSVGHYKVDLPVQLLVRHERHNVQHLTSEGARSGQCRVTHRLGQYEGFTATQHPKEVVEVYI